MFLSPGKIAEKAVNNAGKGAVLAVVTGTALGVKAIKRETYLRDASQLNETELEQWMTAKAMLPNEKNKFKAELAKYRKRKAQGAKKRGLIRAAKLAGAAGTAAAAGTVLGGATLAGGAAIPLLATGAGVGALGYGSYHGVQGAYHGGRQIKKGLQKKLRKPSRTRRSRKGRKRRKSRRPSRYRKKSRKRTTRRRRKRSQTPSRRRRKRTNKRRSRRRY